MVMLSLALKKNEMAVKLLCELLNNNQLYVNLSEMEDEQFGISDEGKRLNQLFYGGKAVCSKAY